MYNTIGAYRGENRTYGRNPSFGWITDDAKAVINSPEIRTILRKEYHIKKRQMRILSDSPFQVGLLKARFKGTRLPDTAGLVVYPNKASGLESRVIAQKDQSKIAKTNNFTFASFVKQAIDMCVEYNNQAKKLGSHEVNKEWRKDITKVERKIKPMMREIVSAHNNSLQGNHLKKVESKIKRYDQEELLIDRRNAHQRLRADREMIGTVNETWDKILANNFGYSA